VSAERLRVEVVYSPAPRAVERRELELQPGSTLADALLASGLPGAGAPADLVYSVWCRPQPPGHLLRDRDRVEICRALVVDPKEARRLRYRRQRKPKAGTAPNAPTEAVDQPAR
jgi:putative ubiquitin-RnfH superfamily antitoxin RatB of RatAB toxin-antitoxin module